MALGVRTLDDLAHEIEELAAPKMPGGIMDALKMLPMVNQLRDLMPKTVSDAPCQEVVEKNGSLESLPILKCWPDDGGRYARCRSSSPRTPSRHAKRGAGTYRMQVYDGGIDRHALAAAQGRGTTPPCGRASRETAAGGRGPRSQSCARVFGNGAHARRPRRTALRRLPQRRRASSWCRARRSRWKCRPTPRSSSKAGSIRRKRSSKGRSATTPASIRWPSEYPVFHVTAITHRRNPIYPTTIVGKPPMEDYYLGKATSGSSCRCSR